MKRDLLELLVCPACRHALSVHRAIERQGEIENGELACTSCSERFPIVRFVPRFAGADNYSGSFGFQWNQFRRTQLDSFTGQPISRERFFRQSGWQPRDLDGRLTLDIGCGAGRFAEIALSTGARVVAVDYSTAVDACRANLGSSPRLDVIQADVYHLPFRPRAFEFVYCFGVLQHTPDVHAAFLALSDQVAAGGRLSVDAYPRLLANALWPKYWLRPLTRRVRAERLFAIVAAMVPLLWPISLALGRVPLVGRTLRHALPIANYDGILPLPPDRLREWAVLDTFDMLAPAHDHPITVATMRQWLERAGLVDTAAFRDGLVVGRGARAA
jgi:uncharacterized protein YbaR (Trm112 family)/2-polyprenyl-3-methyl-5-hydroxy-6-metoxy-1,4-benzoquinol methylase